MKRFKVYVTRRIPKVGIEILSNECDVEINPYDRIMTRVELEKAIIDVDGLLCMLTDLIDEALLDHNPNLKAISNYAAGFNNIALSACTQRRIAVTNTPGIITETTADLTWSLLMTIARRIIESDKFTRKDRYNGWDPLLLLGEDIYGKTLGIVGRV